MNIQPGDTIRITRVQGNHRHIATGTASSCVEIGPGRYSLRLTDTNRDDDGFWTTGTASDGTVTTVERITSAA